MSKILAMLCFGFLAAAVMSDRTDLNLLDSDSFAHCGKCGDGDAEDDHEHEGDDEESFVHCGKCGDGDAEDDHEHEGDDEESFVHCGKCGDGDAEEDHDHEEDEESFV
ncbi:hypothetical protein [Bythopirellula goksoeyrii]|uniref:Uncharacterized protein n=1 Tax=Bythopirellula goksoeyrii TaxID=1400387 RepID=A0A5B9QGK6_9BACT|nr:hypothetical protein [Bythopirellula goksoeyrii]QEG33481.1 hypothetical protein Pr1d_07450 [Bythopirellula goksoeyrii]